ncbi:N-alpha-acetyltransferase 38, NatC auxiliary subunit isoform X1 [Phasianus colchicus]|uniref:N-alpha-acetyltransferase 38, NatC auxiliary subunit isoform X1 n=1 Tax=Phasianus colchicus TaxID=9054 RepID=UPI00129EEEC3|nr:N-alpha-acetyltransferase 38, NatC auxiliary subunit isoform X1 [Phasianus colchicus]
MAEPAPPGGPQPRARRLAALLNRSLRVRMSDGRTLVGAFLCTDRDANIILGSAQEFLKAAVSGICTSAQNVKCEQLSSRSVPTLRNERCLQMRSGSYCSRDQALQK